MKEFSPTNIAILITCHNRKEKTLSCLQSLAAAKIPDNCQLQVYLVDDGSTDGTSDAVTLHFPQVKTIRGNGQLFWNQGMRLAWDTASATRSYDFYIWMNDDTQLNNFAICELFENYQEIRQTTNQPAIITGACESHPGSHLFSYGGKTDSGPVIPDGKLQTCQYINGNVVWVPRPIFEELGNLSPDYTHGMGDYDYGLRAQKAGYRCYNTKN